MTLSREGENVTVSGVCRQAGLSRQAFYKQRRERRREAVETAAIVELVKAQRRIHPRIGARKLLFLLRRDLAEMGIVIGRDRFFALLREQGLLVRRRRRRARTTDSRHRFRVYRNLIRHIEPCGPNQVWVSDLTYLRTEAGFLYLSLITDAYSRKIVGFDVSDRLEAEGCLRALRVALGDLPEGLRPIHHSDRGAQYCCGDYVGLLDRRGLAISMTESNHCYENAQAERVNGILKGEYGLDATFRTKARGIATAREAIAIYNELRPHLGLGFRTPSAVHGLAA